MRRPLVSSDGWKKKAQCFLRRAKPPFWGIRLEIGVFLRVQDRCFKAIYSLFLSAAIWAVRFEPADKMDGLDLVTSFESLGWIFFLEAVVSMAADFSHVRFVRNRKKRRV